jgi:hypothetical protein
MIASSYEANDTLTRALERLADYERTHETNLLLYAALETRLCIERTLFEYLVLIRSGEVPRKLERLYAATDLKNAILREEPQFFRKLEFLNIFLPFTPGEEVSCLSIVIPDLDLLSRAYGRANDYLHAPKRPDTTWFAHDWWEQLLTITQQVVQHLVTIRSAPMGAMHLNTRGEALFDRFVSGSISADEVRAELEQEFHVNPIRQ